jgi:large subunit ribosomal protein L18
MHKTLVSFSSLQLKGFKGDKLAIAKQVGLELAKIAKDKSIDKPLFFDRGSYRFHGRVRALATGLREGGLKF